MNIYVNYSFSVVESNPDTVVILCQKALILAENLTDPFHRSRIFQNMGIAYDIKNNLDSCLYFLNKARKIYKIFSEPLKESFVVNDIAIAYHYRGIYEVALRLHYEALSLREKAKDSKLIAQSFNNIGVLYRAKKDYPNAIRFLQQSLHIKKQIKDEAGIINSTINIGSCFQHMENFDSALYYARESKALAMQYTKPDDLTGALCNEGIALKGLKQYSKAEPVLHQALAAAVTSNNTSVLLTCYEGLGDIGFENKQPDTALKYYMKGQALVLKSGRWKEQLAVFYQNTANCFAEKKQFEKAYYYFRNCKTLQDTLLNEENIRHINEMNALYETEKKENQITQLHGDVAKGNAVNEKSINERNYLLLSSLLLLLLAAVAMVAFRNNRKKTVALNEQKLLLKGHWLIKKYC